jgi:hypothetical protein
VSTLSEREAALRRALQSAAASIEPAPDGLERIQARLRRPRPLAIAWLEAAWTDFFLRARAAVETAGPMLARGMRHVWQRFGPDSVPDRGRGLRWLRPLAALSLAIFVVAAGAYVGFNGSALFATGTAGNSRTYGSSPTAPAGSGHPKPEGSGSAVPSASQPDTSASPGCKKTPKPNGRFTNQPSSKSSSPNPSSTSPTPTPTPSSGSPSPSPSDSTSTPDPADTTAATDAGSDGAPATDSTASTSQAQSAVNSAADKSIGTPAISTAVSTRSLRRHGAKPSPSPCASKTTAALTRPAGLTTQESEAITLASAQLTTGRLDKAVQAARLNEHFAA